MARSSLFVNHASAAGQTIAARSSTDASFKLSAIHLPPMSTITEYSHAIAVRITRYTARLRLKACNSTTRRP
jgi:hypothetical protein